MYISSHYTHAGMLTGVRILRTSVGELTEDKFLVPGGSLDVGVVEGS